MVISREDRVGVRATGRFAADYVARHCPVGVTVNPEKKENEPWRRITGMTVGYEEKMDRKERRAGIRDLIDWIEKWVDEAGESVRGEMAGGSGVPLVAERPGPLGRATQGFGGDGDAIGFGEAGGFRSPHPGFASLISALSVNSRGGPAGREGAESWACEGQAREMVAGVCIELNISRHKLSELTREYRGISCTELIDGFRVQRVRRGIAELLKLYARELWMAPGLYAGVLVMDERLKVYGGKSEFFVDPDETFRRRDHWEALRDRRAELISAFDGGWKRAEMSRDGFAVGLGFRSFSELNRACLNVFGKSVRQLADFMTSEIVEFYLAKEQEQLRELAVCELRSAGIARARYLYWGGMERREGCSALVSVLWDALAGDARDVMEKWMNESS